jgi:protein TonB
MTGDVRPPERLVFIKPEYPQEARDRKEEGKVVLEIIVDREGAVADAKVLKSNPTFDEAALKAVRLWKYKPATKDGRPVKVYLTVIVDFTLK